MALTALARRAAAGYPTLSKVLVLLGLFLIQKHGTERIGIRFGPIMVLWFDDLLPEPGNRRHRHRHRRCLPRWQHRAHPILGLVAILEADRSPAVAGFDTSLAVRPARPVFHAGRLPHNRYVDSLGRRLAWGNIFADA